MDFITWNFGLWHFLPFCSRKWNFCYCWADLENWELHRGHILLRNWLFWLFARFHGNIVKTVLANRGRCMKMLANFWRILLSFVKKISNNIMKETNESGDIWWNQIHLICTPLFEAEYWIQFFACFCLSNSVIVHLPLAWSYPVDHDLVKCQWCPKFTHDKLKWTKSKESVIAM